MPFRIYQYPSSLYYVPKRPIHASPMQASQPACTHRLGINFIRICMHVPVRDPKSPQSSLRRLPKSKVSFDVSCCGYARNAEPHLALQVCISYCLPASECPRSLLPPSCALIMQSTRGKQGCKHEGLSQVPNAGSGVLLGACHAYCL